MKTIRATHARDPNTMYPAPDSQSALLAHQGAPWLPQPSPTRKQAKPRAPRVLRWLRGALVVGMLGLGIAGGACCFVQNEDIGLSATRATSAVDQELLAIDLIQAHEATAIAALGPGTASQLPEQAEAALADAMPRIDRGAQDTPDPRVLFLKYATALDRAAQATDPASARTTLVAAATYLDGLLPDFRTAPAGLFESRFHYLTAFGLLVASLVVGASVVTARVTHRVINVGLLIAFACALGVAFAPLHYSEATLEHARSSNGAMHAIATARYDLAQARNADLRAALAQSNADNTADLALARAEEAIAGNDYSRDLSNSLSAYSAAHRRVAIQLEGGHWDAALELALATGNDAPSSTAAVFDQRAGAIQAMQWSDSDTTRCRESLALMAVFLFAPLAAGGAFAASRGIRQAQGRYR